MKKKMTLSQLEVTSFITEVSKKDLNAGTGVVISHPCHSFPRTFTITHAQD